MNSSAHLPCCAPDHTRHGAWMNTKLTSEGSLRFAREMAVTNPLHLFRGQLGVTIPRPDATAPKRAPLLNHVGGVVGGRSEPQMRRFTASTVIAAVHHDKPRWDTLLVDHLEHEAMHERLLPTNAEQSVAITGATSPIQTREVESRH